MRVCRIALAAAMLAAMISPAAAQRGGYGGGTYGSPHDMPDHASRPVSRDAASLAEDLRLKGRCDKAVPLLRQLADVPGAEVSQFNLGLCLLDLAAAEHDAQAAAALKSEAAKSILKAANSGFARAQAQAVTLYLDGTGVAADPVEADKWALLYRSNSVRFALGLPDLAHDVSARLDSQVTDAQADEAQQRAAAWQPVTQSYQ